MNAPDPVVHAAAQMIPLAFIAPSTTNPRKHFDETQLAELTDSVRRHGVLQPILVRSGRSSKDPRILWELVAGERRYRAAKSAGIEEIPAVVRSLTDVEALELQVVENLQRADLHPLEEAEGYDVLMKRHKYTSDDIAAKVGTFHPAQVQHATPLAAFLKQQPHPTHFEDRHARFKRRHSHRDPHRPRHPVRRRPLRRPLLCR